MLVSALKEVQSCSWNDIYQKFLHILEARMTFVYTDPDGKEHSRFGWNLEDYIECLDAAIDLDPTNTESYLERAIFHCIRREYQKSLKDIQEALRLNPSFPGAMFWVAHVRYQMGEYACALKAAEEAESRLPWSYELCELKRDILEKIGEKKRAKRCSDRMELLADYRIQPVDLYKTFTSLEQAVREKKIDLAWELWKSPVVSCLEGLERYYWSAAIKEAEGDLQGALQDIDVSNRFYKSYSKYRTLKGRLLRRKGFLEESLSELSYSINLAKKLQKAWPYLERGITRKLLGDKAGAMQDLDNAILTFPSYASAYLERGFLFLELGERDKAMADFDQEIGRASCRERV